MTDYRTEITTAAKTKKRADDRAEAATTALVNLVVKALRDDQRPTDVVEWSGYTAAYVRRLARAHGIEAPDRRRAGPES